MPGLVMLLVLASRWGYAEDQDKGISAQPRPGISHTAEPALRTPPWWPAVRSAKAGIPVAAVLPAPDRSKLLAEDAMRMSGDEKGLMRIGILRDLPEPLEFSGGALPWIPLDDGTLWSAVAVVSLDALGMRLGFSTLSVPAGLKVWVIDASSGDGMECVPPEVFMEPLWWGPSCSGQEVWLAFHAPANVAQNAVSGTLVKVAHIYRDPVAEAKVAGSCNIDAACAPEPWASMLGYCSALVR